jgi:phytoene synthase
MDRVYVPLLHLPGASAAEPAPALVRHPGFVPACALLSERAAEGFLAADRMLDRLDRRQLRPAVLMMEAYRAMFERMRARGWKERGPRAKLTRADKLRLIWIAVGPPGAALSGETR